MAGEAARRVHWRCESDSRQLGGTRETPSVRPYNTKDTYPERSLDSDLCRTVVVGHTVHLRSQIGQDLDTRESVGIGDIEGQAEKAMANIAMLLEVAAWELGDLVQVIVRLTDVRFREPGYRVMGRWLKRLFPVSTGLVVTAPARVEWLCGGVGEEAGLSSYDDKIFGVVVRRHD